MNTYRIQFSSSNEVLSRRLRKAAVSGAQRLLFKNFEGSPPRSFATDKTWALELETGRKHSEDWDEIHALIHNPCELRDLVVNEKTIVVLQPQTRTADRLWYQALQEFKKSFAGEIFIEFGPWSSAVPERYSVNEVANFLSMLRYNFPEEKWRPRPGVELWNDQITEQVELEADYYFERIYSWKESTPRLSVVIPSYNSKFFVFKVLEHLRRQDTKDFEVILVDDGSSDGSQEYIETFGPPKELQLKVIYWPRTTTRIRGDSFFRAGLARNLGVRNARAENLLFLDADILVPTNFVSVTLENLSSNDVLQFPRLHIKQDISNSQVSYEEISIERQCYTEEEHYWSPFFASEKWVNLEKYWKYTCTYALAMSKKSFNEAGRFRRYYVSYGFEDTELGYRLAQLRKKFHLVKLPVLHLTSYSQSEYQMSQRKRTKLLRKTAKLFFLSTLDLENYYHFRGFMNGEPVLRTRIKKNFYDRYKNKLFGVVK